MADYGKIKTNLQKNCHLKSVRTIIKTIRLKINVYINMYLILIVCNLVCLNSIYATLQMKKCHHINGLYFLLSYFIWA